MAIKKQAPPSLTPTDKSLEEDWSPRRFYRTMLYLFRERSGESSENPEPITPPFFENRPITFAEFSEAQYLFVMHVYSQEWLKVEISSSDRSGTIRQNSKGQAAVERLFSKIHALICDFPLGPPSQAARERLANQWVCASAKDRKRWELFRLVSTAYFADTAEEQSRARKRLRARLSGRPTPLTQLCREFLCALPQAKAKIGSDEVFLQGCGGLVGYWAERRFLWTFLRNEVRSCEGTSLKNLRPSVLDDYAKALCEAYPYLHLPVSEIRAGLTNSRQAEQDAAEEFGLKVGTVRSILSRFRSHHQR